MFDAHGDGALHESSDIAWNRSQLASASNTATTARATAIRPSARPWHYTAFLQEFWKCDTGRRWNRCIQWLTRCGFLSRGMTESCRRVGRIWRSCRGASSFRMEGEDPKHVGALYVTCQLFKIYFKVECIMAILIYRNLIKGYFAH
ncbi:uncharacterized protein [Elaeis guineensis]|uniref:uncharacterized protein n=1 Tax=Elaeis guineensis var. tenera TaxID=51953 RepID=UPI003C6D6A43